MSRMEIIRSMSEDDALLALQAARAAIQENDMDGATAALEEMSTEGLHAFVSFLEESVRRKA